MNRAYLAAALAAAVLASAGLAHAGGMVLPTRGVRPSARAGAFVAGADDLGAMWFNPAGLAEAAGSTEEEPRKTELLVDFGYVAQSTSYTRLDSGNNEQPTVENEAPGLPIPTLAMGFDIGQKGVLAVGVMAPYAALGKYDDDGAQRYSLMDLSESLLAIVQVSYAHQVTDDLRVGIGVQNMVFHLASTVVFAACPGTTVCAPEDPEFDAVAKVTQTDWLVPSGVVGLQYQLGSKTRVGAAFQLPFAIGGQGKVETVLPDSGFYNGATVVGDRADVEFSMPSAFRAGIEIRPTPRWRVEAAVDYEMWSQHDEMSIEPQDVRIEGAPGVGTYELGPLSIPRHYDDSVAVALGIEGQPSSTLPLRLLAGYAFETAAAPDAYLSVLTVDGAKHIGTFGLGYALGGYTIDAMLGVVAVETREVTREEGRAPQLTPIRDSDPVYVNWGTYESSWFMAGASLKRGF